MASSGGWTQDASGSHLDRYLGTDIGLLPLCAQWSSAGWPVDPEVYGVGPGPGVLLGAVPGT